MVDARSLLIILLLKLSRRSIVLWRLGITSSLLLARLSIWGCNLCRIRHICGTWRLSRSRAGGLLLTTTSTYILHKTSDCFRVVNDKIVNVIIVYYICDSVAFLSIRLGLLGRLLLLKFVAIGFYLWLGRRILEEIVASLYQRLRMLGIVIFIPIRSLSFPIALLGTDLPSRSSILF